jgi:hypothetical protein
MESRILTKALQEAAPDDLSAAFKIAEGTPVCAEVPKAIAVALGYMKRKVGGMLLELWRRNRCRPQRVC